MSAKGLNWVGAYRALPRVIHIQLMVSITNNGNMTGSQTIVIPFMHLYIRSLKIFGKEWRVK